MLLNATERLTLISAEQPGLGSSAAMNQSEPFLHPLIE